MEKKEKQVNVTLETSVYDKMKIQAIKDGMTIKRWIESILLDYVKDSYEPKEAVRHYNTKDIALFLQCDRKTVTNYYKRGSLKGVKYKNEYWSTADQVKEFLNNRKEKK